MMSIGSGGSPRMRLTRFLATAVVLGLYCAGTVPDATPARAQSRGRGRGEKSAKCVAAETELSKAQRQEKPLQDELAKVDRTLEQSKSELAQYDLMLSATAPISAPGMSRVQILVLRENLKQRLDQMVAYRDKILESLIPLHNRVLELQGVRDRECK